MRRRKHEHAIAARLTGEDAPRLGIEGNLPRPRLAVDELQHVVPDLGPAQPQDLVLAAPGQQQEPDDVGVLAVALPVLGVEHTVQPGDLLARQETRLPRPAVALNPPRRVGLDVTPGDGEVHHLTQDVESPVGVAGRGAAEGIEPAPDLGRGNAVERLLSEGGQEPGFEEPGRDIPGRRLVAGEMRLLPFVLDELAERRHRARRRGGFRHRAGPSDEAFPADLLDAHHRDRPERDALRAAPVSSSMTQAFPPVGRTRTPRPGTLLSQTVYSRTRGRRRATAASVSFLRSLAGIIRPPILRRPSWRRA